MKLKNTCNIRFYLAGLIGLATFLVYLPALRNGFVYWDDNLYIFENPYIRSLDGAFFRWAFLDFHVSNWHPLTWVSHALDYAIWGVNPMGHHLASIIFHSINAGLVVLLVMRLMEVSGKLSEFVIPASEARRESFRKDSGQAGMTDNGDISILYACHKAGFSDKQTLIAAGVTGLLFGLHPLHVESVAWVSERKDLLCALFFLLSVIAYVRYAGGIASSNPPTLPLLKGGKGGLYKYYILSLIFFILALLSKPMAVSLPVVLLILDWYPFGRIVSMKTAWKASVEKLPFIVLSLASSVITILAQKAGGAVETMGMMPLKTRLLVSADSLIGYMGKMLFPVHLLPFYPYPKDASLLSIEYVTTIYLAIGITAACLMLAGKQKVWLSAWGYYVATLLPVLGVVQVGGQAMADRYTYLPSLGPFLIAGVCAAWVAEKMPERERRWIPLRLLGAGVALVLVVSLSYLTVVQSAIWRNSISLWTYVIDKGTEKLPMAYVNRGAAFQKDGMPDRAVADYEAAIGLDPSDYRAYISLGAVLEQMGRFDSAKAAVERAIVLSPSSHEAFRNRGILYEKMLQFDEAVADYTKAIALKPSYFEAYNNRGLTYAKMGRFDEAIEDYDDAIRLNPRYVGAYNNRGVAYTLTGRYDRALEDFNTAIGLAPADPVSFFNRGMFYRRTGKNGLAIADVRKSCELGNEKACGMLRELTP